MNALSTIAEGIKTAIAGANLGQAFTVQRYFVPPDYVTAATRELQVQVVGFEEVVDLKGPNRSRTECDHVYGVHVAIVKQVTAPNVTSTAAIAELDGLSDVRERVIDLLKPLRVVGGATQETLTNSPAAGFDPIALDQKKVFLSVIKAEYRMLR